MDNRLGHVGQKRVSRLRQQDLPVVAFALATQIRRLTPVQVNRTTVSGAPTIVFTSDYFQVPILIEDWNKIEPYVRDDTFSPVALPPFSGYMLLRPDAELTPDSFSQDPLYQIILQTLKGLFPDSYPTSDY